MAEDHIRYDILAQEALRGVVRKVLKEVAKTGLPSDHHFFISFATHAPGVRISETLLTEYEKEMTIVLQNQFWDLIVTDVGFEVGLSFNGNAEQLEIPFSAIKGFFDPSVQFGLQFDVGDPTDNEADADAEIGSDNDSDAGAKKLKSADKAKDSAEEDTEESGEKVVSLDAFRKKP